MWFVGTFFLQKTHFYIPFGSIETDDKLKVILFITYGSDPDSVEEGMIVWIRLQLIDYL